MKFKISHKETKFDFFLHKTDKMQGAGLLKIFKGLTYPILPKINPKLILDVGANIGATSVFFSLNYPNAKIFAFEPTAMNFELLKKNVGSLQNIFPINKGAYSYRTKKKVYLDSDSGGKNSIYKNWTKSKQFEEIELVDLSEFLDLKEIDNVDILKIDTEGCEVQILKSLRDRLHNIEAIYLEFHSKTDKEEIFKILSHTHNLITESVRVRNMQVSASIINKISFNDVGKNNVSIVGKNQKISKKNLDDLIEAKIKNITVVIEDLGELIFLSHNIKVKKLSEVSVTKLTN